MLLVGVSTEGRVRSKMDSVNFEKINLLLKAPSKEYVIGLCNEAFMLRNASKYPTSQLAQIMLTLSLQSDMEASELLSSLGCLIKKAIFQGSSEASDLVALFPGDFNKSLASLLVKIILQKFPIWNQQSSDSLVFLPRLVDFDWRVDIKTSSDCLARMSVPTCFLQLQVEEPVTSPSALPARKCINAELSQQTLDTMLDGLTRIRDQLSSVASK